MKKRKNIITVAIDSPAAAGAGTQSKMIAKNYNLTYLDTGKIYRYLGLLVIQKNNKVDYSYLYKKIKKITSKTLSNKKLLNENVAKTASVIAKKKKIRNMVHAYQKKFAYNPPKKYSGSILDGRDITTIQVKDAMFKFYITASLNERAKRRFLEYKIMKKKISFKEVLKSLKNRDKSDRTRKYGPLKKTKDSILINTTKLSKKACFMKIKAIMDRKLKS